MTTLKNIILATAIGLGINCHLDLDALRGTGYQDGSAENSDSSSAAISNSSEYDGNSSKPTPRDSGSEMRNPDSGEDAPSVGCYRNNFDSFDSLDDLILQNGMWSRHPEGYLMHNDELEKSWRVAYFDNFAFDNFAVGVRIRMFDSTNPGAGVDSHHAGIVVRYNPDDNSGYIIQLQHANVNTLQISIDNYSGGNVANASVICGEVGCGYQRWYEMDSTVSGENLVVRLNGEEVLDINSNLHTQGFMGFVTYGGREIHYDDLEICTD